MGVCRERLIKELKFKGLSDTEIARRLRVSRSLVSQARARARRRGMVIPRWSRYPTPTEDIVYGIVLAIARNNGGYALAGEVYELYRAGAEEGFWEQRTEKRLAEILRGLEGRGLIERERVSLGRHGATSVIRPLRDEETFYSVFVEEMLLR